ncbi:superoxide dismutase, Ni [Acaryochloris marina]|uniref:Ni-containing superoxide dismutase, putative n=1 Tax=Acaryochloris marina (strain MBIC 11017) TaxID=329726 RepID=B0CC21_ACAM1|nr:superoxide dismutase, Ni [Acaryochloris marina]ABW25563.1 Ni-containing superoxide dismutase, putative [Acaryochloris marina MBIC11017]BDM80443.1 superoxide dismutase, Ni [Acaryochloris marina MBIC10699]
MVLRQIKTLIKRWFPTPVAHAHCDGPCGVYDPATARIYTEAVVSMTRKILDLQPPADQNPQAMATYLNTMSRYIQIKEEQAQKAKEEILILWTDYFKPQHLEQYPNLHDMFWKAAKLCSSCKVEVNLQHAEELLAAVEEVHKVFWATKNRTDVSWYKAS